MKKIFEGIVPAVITPMDSSGEINEDALRKVVEFNINSGVHGLWVAGGTGESILLSDEENTMISKIVSEQNDTRTNIIMHVGSPTTTRSAYLAEQAAKAGVEAICCVPPFFYKGSDDQIVQHYKTVANAANLPFFVYNLPDATGVEITPSLMSKIQDNVPQLTGLKHSSQNFDNVRTFSKMGLRCFIGSSRQLLPALTVGAAGCVDGPPSVAPEIWVLLWEQYSKEQLKKAELTQDRAIDFAELIAKDGYLANIKALTGYRLGIDCGTPRSHDIQLSVKALETLIREASLLGIDRAVS